MKELTAHTKEEIKTHAEQQQEKQKKFDGYIERHPGQFVYQVDLRTQVISKAEFSEEVLNFESGKLERKIIRKEHHWYCAAINEKNAFRKFNNMAKSFLEKLKPPST